MRNQTCCFTGSREIKSSDRERMRKCLYAEIEKLIAEGYTYFGTGGCYGFDFEASLAILDLKAIYPHIKLILVLPFLEQAERWTQEQISNYEHLKRSADKVTYTAEHYSKGCYHKRNRHLVDCSSVCIAYQTKNTGGTAYTVKYAKEQSVRVIHIEE